eukprot:647351-Rhodomonas_salina.1
MGSSFKRILLAGLGDSQSAHSVAMSKRGKEEGQQQQCVATGLCPREIPAVSASVSVSVWLSAMPGADE